MMRVHCAAWWLLAVALAACTSNPPPPSTGGPPSVPAGGTPLTNPTPDPQFSQSPTGCPPGIEVSGPWPSDRLIDVTVTAGPPSDLVTFVFDPPSTPGAQSIVTIGPATGPFERGGSGDPVTVAGGAFIEARFEALLLHDEAGVATFEGTRDIRANLTQVKHVVAIDESEGMMVWIIGTDFGCSALETNPAAGTITIGWGHAVP